MESVSKETLQRLPGYLRYLKEMNESGIKSISSTAIADRFGFSAVQVRKDLASVSAEGGKPKTGFSIEALIEDINEFLGYNNVQGAILVGVGKLGSALLGYKGFRNYGLEIVASFDAKKDINAVDPMGRAIYDMSKMEDLVRRLCINIGIITVPAKSAQEVCDLMIKAGIKAIWNFSPVNLSVPNGIAVKNEDMAASLALLSQQLADIIKGTH